MIVEEFTGSKPERWTQEARSILGHLETSSEFAQFWLHNLVPYFDTGSVVNLHSRGLLQSRVFVCQNFPAVWAQNTNALQPIAAASGWWNPVARHDGLVLLVGQPAWSSYTLNYTLNEAIEQYEIELEWEAFRAA